MIFTSDHGDMLGAHRLQMKNATAYKEVANIPLLIRGGEKGKVVDAPASHIDLVPTILDYMGLPIPKLLEGKSMLKQIYDTKSMILYTRNLHGMRLTMMALVDCRLCVRQSVSDTSLF